MLAERLNAAANSNRASHHRLELVRRGPETFFVTCSRSPRFNWSVSLTHRDVGRNLDFFAPGHISPDLSYSRYDVFFVEKNSLVDIMGETVLQMYLNDDAAKHDFHEFNKKREDLFNSTMERLGLHYRFKCVVVSPEVLDSIPPMMALDPPPQRWWDDHCFFVNGLPNRILDINLVFCGFKTKYASYWPLIQMTFDFAMKYKCSEYWSTTGTAYWKSVEVLFQRIKNSCDQDAKDDFEKFFDEIKEELAVLARKADNPSNTSSVTIPRRFNSGPRHLRTLRKVRYKLRSMKDIVCLYLFERYKLTGRLVRQGIDCPSSGEVDAFQWFKI
jgi:hypothetical protein